MTSSSVPPPPADPKAFAAWLTESDSPPLPGPQLSPRPIAALHDIAAKVKGRKLSRATAVTKLEAVLNEIVGLELWGEGVVPARRVRECYVRHLGEMQDIGGGGPTDPSDDSADKIRSGFRQRCLRIIDAVLGRSETPKTGSAKLLAVFVAAVSALAAVDDDPEQQYGPGEEPAAPQPAPPKGESRRQRVHSPALTKWLAEYTS